MNLEVIKKRIRDKGLKKSFVADKIGISNVLFSYYITESRPMPDHIKNRLEELLK
jgi:predicted transcriptional regulator